MAKAFDVDTRDLTKLAEKYKQAQPKVQRLAQAFLYDTATSQSKAIAARAPGQRLPQLIQPYARGWQTGVSIAPTKPKDLVRYIRGGTRKHPIFGHPLLAFMWRGRQRFFAHVMHPGTKANDFVKKGVKDFEPTFKKMKQELVLKLKRAMLSS